MKKKRPYNLALVINHISVDEIRQITELLEKLKTQRPK